jgi:hypothetical protein
MSPWLWPTKVALIIYWFLVASGSKRVYKQKASQKHSKLAGTLIQLLEDL